MLCWMRKLVVRFTSSTTKQVIEIGNDDKYNLTMNVQICKYLSMLKDNAYIKIRNLSYDIILQLINSKFFDVEILTGYESNDNLITIFKGGVLYISNGFEENRDTVLLVSCGSQLIAKYSQRRLNLTLNSGINLYTGLKYICLKSGIRNSNISTKLKEDIIKNKTTINKTTSSYFDDLMTQYDTMCGNSDASNGSPLTFFNAARSNNRLIELDNRVINLNGGYPSITQDGLIFSMMPTFDLSCGDTIKIDNSIINLGGNGDYKSDAQKGYYLDKEGYYMITELKYTLENRGNTFNCNVKCKSRSRVANYLGVK